MRKRRTRRDAALERHKMLRALQKKGGTHTYAEPWVKRTASYKRADRLEQEIAPKLWMTPGLSRANLERLADAWERAGFTGWADNYRAHARTHHAYEVTSARAGRRWHPSRRDPNPHGYPRVLLLKNPLGWSTYKAGRYYYVVGESTRGGMILQDEDRASRPGERAILLAKSPTGGAVWFLASNTRMTRRKTISRDVTPRRAEIIRRRSEAFKRARETYDPKRYKRGGGYKPEEYAEIARRAGGKAPSNRALSKLQVHEFKTNPPDKLIAYYDEKMTKVTTWMGDKLGDIVWKGAKRSPFRSRLDPFGGQVMNIRVRGINGVDYVGTCNLSSGTYCRLRRASTRRRRS